MKVKILTNTTKLLEEEAREVVLPGQDGEFSVMDFHQPCLYSLRPGWMKVRFRKGKGQERILVKKGIVMVEPFKLTALIETELKK